MSLRGSSALRRFISSTSLWQRLIQLQIDHKVCLTLPLPSKIILGKTEGLCADISSKKGKQGVHTFCVHLVLTCSWKLRRCSVKQLRCPYYGNLTCLGTSLAFCLRGRSSCCNVLNRNTQEYGTMQCLVGYACCCNRNTSSVRAATCKKFAYRLKKPGNLKYSR